MNRRKLVNIPASIHQQLLASAEKNSVDFLDILRRYGTERFLFRLSESRYAEEFVLKGAALFLIWTGEYYRPTRDIDFLSLDPLEPKSAESMIREICSRSFPDDGLIFDQDSIKAGRIKEDDIYNGVRVTLQAKLDRTRIPVRIDIGFGDAMTPHAIPADFPVLLDLPVPHLLIYSRETVIAEKYEALVELGLANSRMKDFYDLWILATAFTFDGILLKTAIQATFRRRKTPLPDGEPIAFTAAFTADPVKHAQWRAFLNKNELTKKEADMTKVISLISAFVMPPTLAAVHSAKFTKKWKPGGNWV